MENTMFELVKICHHKQFLCIHDDVDNLIESALDSKLLSINSINSQSLDKKEQEVKNIEEQPAERRNRAEKEPEHLLSMGYEHLSITPKTESDEVTESNAENLLPILSKCEVTLEDEIECDMPAKDVCSPVFTTFLNPLFKDNDDLDSSDDESLPDEDVPAEEFKIYSNPLCDEDEINSDKLDPHCFNVESDFVESLLNHVILREKLLSINRLIANIESLNDNPTPDCVLNSSVSIPTFEDSNNSLSENSSPEFETFCDNTKETRSCNTTTHADNSPPEYDSFCFEIEPDQKRLINVVKNDISDDSTIDPLLEEVDLFLAYDNSIPPGIENFAYDSEGDIRFLKPLLIDDSIPFLVNESPESDFDNPLFPRPPPEPPDADFELDTGEEISVVMNHNDELECLYPRDEFDDDDYSSFMFVICSKMFFSFLSVESEDTIFDPGFTPHRLKFLVFGYLSRSIRSSHPFFEISLEKSISLINIA
uniref:Reverse transcriptase domain-containing protein n=1 Tax=Tanacetum cinerariifolium TaxID=118510 RepID=A0A6L2P4B1_TANCI|nr:hypothetical protein [Tanacetum cinerariifolium]